MIAGINKIYKIFMANGLGRGLSSLIPQKVNKGGEASGEAVVDLTSDADKDKILKVAPDKIKVNPLQPRHEFNDAKLDELVESVREYGIIQPMIVTAVGGNYELIAGERRLRAAKRLKLKTVPVIVREAGEQEKLEVSLIENLQRQDLNAIETALAYRKLVDEFNLTQEVVAKRVGISRSGVTNTLRLLNLPEDLQAALIEGRISEGHAKLIAGLDDEDRQMSLYHKIVQKKLSVHAAVNEARKMGGTKKARIKINYGDKDKEFALREFFGTKVEIKRKGRGGQILIDFYSDEELNEMIGKVKK